MSRRSERRGLRNPGLGLPGADVQPVTSALSVSSATQYDGATTTQITGTGFISACRVEIDGVEQPSANVTYVSPTRIDLVIPAGKTASAVLASSGSKSITVKKYNMTSNAQTFTVNAWTPASMTSLEGWFIAESGQVTLSATVVDAWTDKIGGTRQLQSSSTGRPVFAASDSNFNNLGSINFDGVNDVLSTGASTTAISTYISASASYFAIIARLKSSDNASGEALINDKAFYFGIQTYPGITANCFNYDGTSDYTAPDISLAVNTTFVLTGRHDSGVMYLQKNDGTETSITTGNTQLLTGFLEVGGNTTNLRFADCYIHQIVLSKNVQTAANRTRYINYAMATCGIT